MLSSIRIYDTVEKGLYSNFDYKMKQGYESLIKKSGIKLYDNLADIIDEFTQTTAAFDLRNFETIFMIYFSIIGFVLVVFIVHHLVISFIIPMHILTKLKMLCKKIYTKIVQIIRKIYEKINKRSSVVDIEQETVEIGETVEIEY